VFVDGPHHESAAARVIDETKRSRLLDAGYRVIEFGTDLSKWAKIFERYRFIFGKESHA
jgi:hypothetical protein